MWKTVLFTATTGVVVKRLGRDEEIRDDVI